MKLEKVEHLRRLFLEQRFEDHRVELAAQLKVVIVALHVGSVGEFQAAFRARGDEIRQAPERGQIAEVGVRGGNGHTTEDGVAGFERAVELECGQDLGAPIRGCVRPRRQNQPRLGGHSRRIGPAVLA